MPNARPATARGGKHSNHRSPSNARLGVARRSRAKRWNDALAEMIAVQAECAAWFEALPESLRDNATAAALQEMIDLDLDAVAAIQPPLGYGRD